MKAIIKSCLFGVLKMHGIVLYGLVLHVFPYTKCSMTVSLCKLSSRPFHFKTAD